jgi:hypothetical protein
MAKQERMEANHENIKAYLKEMKEEIMAKMGAEMKTNQEGLEDKTEPNNKKGEVL